jgi:23S rRNA pseudouridine1911/1915/1917 synthase
MAARIPVVQAAVDDYTAPGAAESPAREFKIAAELAGLRLDQALVRLMPEHSRSRIKAWIDGGSVTVDGASMPPKHRLLGGERLRVLPPPAHEVSMRAQALPLVILHEDASLLVVDKPAGLVVHPGAGNRDGTLANALLHHAPQLALIARAGIVHRLDKDTTGLLVVAKTEAAQRDLAGQLQARTVRREYLALVHGVLTRGGEVDAPIGRHPVRRTSMAVVATGRRAVTHYEVRERFTDCTLLACRLETGRTHQIRVHLAMLKHPLVGDPMYGKRHGIAFPRQALHAWRLGLEHPVTRRAMHWESPLPADFAALLEAVRHR